MNLYEQTQMGEDNEQIPMTVEEYQEYRASCEHVIKQSEMAERLSKNPEFISLIMEDYFKRLEPIRLFIYMFGMMNLEIWRNNNRCRWYKQKPKASRVFIFHYMLLNKYLLIPIQ